MFGEIEFDQRGLAPCVVQDFATGEVLMLAYVSAESLEMTLETGDLHFHSRSRDELWKKGESSGNFMHLRQLRYDCDGDALVAMVDPAGPACHTGQRSCFFRALKEDRLVAITEPLIDPAALYPPDTPSEASPARGRGEGEGI